MSELLDVLCEEGDSPAEDFFSAHRAAYPLNLTCIGMVEGEKSDRLRLREVVSQLRKQGYKVSGAEPKDNLRNAEISFGASFDISGAASGISVTTSAELVPLVQQTMISCGLFAVVTVEGKLMRMRPVPDSEEELRWREMGFNKPLMDSEKLMPWLAEGYPIRDALAAATEGVSIEDFAPWRELNISARVAAGWIRAGSDPAEAQAWAEQGLQQVEQRDEWMRHGFTLSDVKRWREAGPLLTPARLEPLVRAGYTPQSLAPWTRLIPPYRLDVSQILDWKAQGIDDQRAREMVEAGYSTGGLKHVAEWMGKNRMDASESWKWALLGPSFANTNVVRKFKKLGLDPAQIRLWQQALCTTELTPQQVEPLLVRKVDPTVMIAWGEVSWALIFEDHYVEWVKAGLTPADAEPWVALHTTFADFVTTKEWIEAGLTPADAEPWVAVHRAMTSYARVREWADLHPRCADPETVAELIEAGATPKSVQASLQLLG